MDFGCSSKIAPEVFVFLEIVFFVFQKYVGVYFEKKETNSLEASFICSIVVWCQRPDRKIIAR